MAIADRHGLPIAVRVTSASPHESKLVEDTLRQRHVAAVPERMIGDRAYDSDPLDERLQHEQGVELIAPNRKNKRKRTQDKPPLRRHLRRWKIERTFAWLSNFRRLQVRQDRILTLFQGFCHVACLLITLRYF